MLDNSSGWGCPRRGRHAAGVAVCKESRLRARTWEPPGRTPAHAAVLLSGSSGTFLGGGQGRLSPPAGEGKGAGGTGAQVALLRVSACWTPASRGPRTPGCTRGAPGSCTQSRGARKQKGGFAPICLTQTLKPWTSVNFSQISELGRTRSSWPPG